MADSMRMPPAPRQECPRFVQVVSPTGMAPSRAPVTVATRPADVAARGACRVLPTQVPRAIPVPVSSVNKSAPTHVASCPTPSRPASGTASSPSASPSASPSGCFERSTATASAAATAATAATTTAAPVNHAILKGGSIARLHPANAAATGNTNEADGSSFAQLPPPTGIRVVRCDGSQGAQSSSNGRVYVSSMPPTATGGSSVASAPLAPEVDNVGDCYPNARTRTHSTAAASASGGQPVASMYRPVSPPTGALSGQLAAPVLPAAATAAEAPLASDQVYYHCASDLTAGAAASAPPLLGESSNTFLGASPSSNSAARDGYTHSSSTGQVAWGASSLGPEAGYAPAGTPPNPISFAPPHHDAGSAGTSKDACQDETRPGSRLKSVMYRCPDCGEMVPTIDDALAHCSKDKCEGESAKSADSGPRAAPSGSSSAAATPASAPAPDLGCTPTSEQDIGDMPKGEAIAYDERGRPTIVRQLDDGSGSAQTVVKNEDGSTRVFGKDEIDSLADSVKDKSSKWAEDLTAHQLRGLVHEVGQRLLEGSRLYHERLAELEELGENLNFAYFGLTADATEKDVDNAYRKLARKMHPDKNGGTEEAKQKFQQMKERYEALKKKFEADRERENGDKKDEDKEKEKERPKGPGQLVDGEKPEPEDQHSSREVPGAGGDGSQGPHPENRQDQESKDKSGGKGDGKKDGSAKADEEAAEAEEKAKKQKNVSISYDPKDKESMVKTVTKMVKQLKNIDIQMEVLVKELDRVKAAVAAEQP